MKKAFTMIELIFVIVILGILAAVALPKFLGVAQQAHEGNLKGFTGTLNRTVAPSLWSQSITDGKNGSIKDYNDTYGGTGFKTLIDIPKEVNASTIDLQQCGWTSDFNSTLTAAPSPVFAEGNATINGKKYYIVCRDGNATTAPAFALYREVNNTDYKCIAGPCK